MFIFTFRKKKKILLSSNPSFFHFSDLDSNPIFTSQKRYCSVNDNYLIIILWTLIIHHLPLNLNLHHHPHYLQQHHPRHLLLQHLHPSLSSSPAHHHHPLRHYQTCLFTVTQNSRAPPSPPSPTSPALIRRLRALQWHRRPSSLAHWASWIQPACRARFWLVRSLIRVLFEALGSWLSPEATG